MKELAVDYSRCIRDGMCIAACGRDVLRDNGEGMPEMAPGKKALCFECGHCSAVCPVHAMTSPGSTEDGIPLESSLEIDFEQAAQFMLSCRSMRKFKKAEVSRKEILDILEIARRAPSGSNAQPVRWKVVSGREKMERITELTVEWYDTHARYDPLLGKRYNADWIVSRYRGGYDIIMRGAPNAVFAVTSPDARWGAVDSAIALTYFCLAAHARKVGSCWCGFGIHAVAAHMPLREYLGLGEDDVVQGVVFFGYPRITYHATPPRRPVQLEWL